MISTREVKLHYVTNIFMCKFLAIAIFIGGAIFCSVSPSLAQEKTRWADLQFVRQSEVWLRTNNAAGLKHLSIDTISEISLNSSFKKGDFINYNQSDQSYTYGVDAESYFRLNPKVVLWSGISYSNFTGKNMGASAWIDPDFAPFNIVEYADTTRGEKSKETYLLRGATAINLNTKLTLGGKVAYTSANYVKKKDLRHLNKLMDIDLSVGTMYEICSGIEIGINYNYRKRVEDTRFKTYGNTEQSYNSLIAWGTFWGQVEGFGMDGYTGESSKNPLVDKINGFSVQLNTNITQHLQFFNEFTINKREGYFGIKSDLTRVYTEHSADLWNYNGHLSYKRKKALHQLHLSASNEKMKNWKKNPIYDHDQTTDVTYITYEAPTLVLTRKELQASLDYQLYINYSDFNPKWSFRMAADFRNRKQNVSIYPHYRNQTVKQLTGKLNVKRNIVVDKNQYSFDLGGCYSSGSGTPINAGIYSGATNVETTYRSTDFNLYREFEYLTKSSFAIHAGFKYSRLLKNNKIRAFAGINYRHTKATDIEFINGDTFNRVDIRVGCSF